jgi:hypothetical protein
MGSLCEKIVKRNLKLDTLTDATLKKLLEHNLLSQKEGIFSPTKKMIVLFGR